jgi:opacity protein-like surface antigen/outer membrane protease
LYVGGQVGATAGLANVADPFGPSLYGDKVVTPGFLAGGQIGFNWQPPNSRVVLGVEADASWLTSDGTNTCLAFSGSFVSATCHVDPRAIGALTARGGYAFGPDGRTLVYAKGGAAWMHDNIDITTNALSAFLPIPGTSTSASYSSWGWTVGGGVEHALTPAWSMRLEYDYLGFPSATVPTPVGLINPIPGGPFFLTPSTTASVRQNAQELKVGVNYRFGENPSPSWNGVAVDMPYRVAQTSLWGWDVVIGSRVWFSSGKFQWNVGGLPGSPENSDVSRLTYDGLTSYAGEYFQRIDTPWGLFTKGNVGLGAINSGHINDEDWVLPFLTVVPYSNTTSNTSNGRIGYGTIDLGYDVLRASGSKVGPFVGYNYFEEQWGTFGCSQIANPLSDCSPALPGSLEVGTQDATWQSIRVGINADMMLADRVKFSADVAYLPYVWMSGQDNHLLRALTTFQQGTGEGVQLEAILSYFFTPYFSLGAGGRYWSMWTTSATGTSSCPGCGSVTQTANLSTERYGVFLQADYRFGALPEGFK